MFQGCFVALTAWCAPCKTEEGRTRPERTLWKFQCSVYNIWQQVSGEAEPFLVCLTDMLHTIVPVHSQISEEEHVGEKGSMKLLYYMGKIWASCIVTWILTWKYWKTLMSLKYWLSSRYAEQTKEIVGGKQKINAWNQTKILPWCKQLTGADFFRVNFVLPKMSSCLLSWVPASTPLKPQAVLQTPVHVTQTLVLTSVLSLQSSV